jgi:hypothetical protein
MSPLKFGHLIANIIVCAGVLSSISASRARAQTLEWARQFGSAETDSSRDISADGLGSVYIVGGTGGSGFPPGDAAGFKDAYVSKLDAAGNLQWTRHIVTDQYDVSLKVSADRLGNVYVSGGSGGYGAPLGYYEAFLHKYDAAGNLQWARQPAPSSQNSLYWEQGLAADSLGNVYTASLMWVEPNGGFYDVILSKYDAEGNVEWAKQLGSPALDIVDGLAADGLGNVYISRSGLKQGPGVGEYGSFLGKYDAAGNLQWSKQFSEDSIGALSADSLGNVYSLGNGLRKFDSAGNLQWTTPLEPSVDGSGLSADGLGNVYLSGNVAESFWDSLVSKYDADGALQWTRLPGSEQADYSTGISADGLGNVYLSGNMYFSGDATDDVFVAKFNDCEGCEPPPLPPIAVDATLGGLILPGSLVTHQFTTSFGDVPVTWSNLVSVRPTMNPPTLTESGLFSWQTARLDGAGLYQFDVTATNAGGSDVGRLTLRLAIIPEPSMVLLVSLGVVALTIVLRARR